MRRGSELLSDLLEGGRILSHPFVVGELTLGGLKRAYIDDLLELPPAAVATDHEVLDLIVRHRLAGRGIGCVDAHLLASTLLMGDAQNLNVRQEPALDCGVDGRFRELCALTHVA